MKYTEGPLAKSLAVIEADDYLKKHPDALMPEVVADLKAKGYADDIAMEAAATMIARKAPR